jgi:hypothetical protein
MSDAVDYSQLPLRDIHLPGAIGFWPPALGWWLVAALVLAGLALAAVYYYRGRHRRVALRSLKRVRAALEQGAEPVACLQMLSTVLRRFAMTTARAERAVHAAGTVPGLIGEGWLKYLDSRWQRHEFVKGLGRELLAAPYGRPNSIERGTALELTGLCTAWLTAQPRTAQPRTPQPRTPRASGA